MTIDASVTAGSEPLAFLESNDANGIYHLVLNRPDSRNALSKQMVRDIHRCLLTLLDGLDTRRPSSSRLASPPRVLIVEGRGSSFCAGADLKERSEMGTEEVMQFLKSLRIILDALQQLPIPTIAAVDGPALGGGLELALACDFRLAAGSVEKIGFPEVTLGVIPGAGGTQRAPRIIGLVSDSSIPASVIVSDMGHVSPWQQKAKELIFTGAPITAQEAHRIGLVDRIVEEPSCLEMSRQLARSMLSAAPLSLQSAKAAIMGGTQLQLDEGLDLEMSCYEPLLDSNDRKEALLAFSEKRKPIFD